MGINFELVAMGATKGVREHRRALAESALAVFGATTPVLPLLIYLDQFDSDEMKLEIGAANRGAFFPTFARLPRHLQPLLPLDYGPAGDAVNNGCIIYLHGSTCEDDTALVMTLAHELQHFLQYSGARPVWAANLLATWMPKEIYLALGFKWADIATEREARIIGKRVAEDLCGAFAVTEYIRRRIDQPANAADEQDSRFIQSINTREPFDLSAATHAMFRRMKDYQSQLADLLCREARNPIFNKVNLADWFADTA